MALTVLPVTAWPFEIGNAAAQVSLAGGTLRSQIGATTGLDALLGPAKLDEFSTAPKLLRETSAAPASVRPSPIGSEVISPPLSSSRDITVSCCFCTKP